jgi:hypothetical protein
MLWHVSLHCDASACHSGIAHADPAVRTSLPHAADELSNNELRDESISAVRSKGHDESYDELNEGERHGPL